MSGIAGGLQQIGDVKATIGLYISPILAIIFCACGIFLIKASKQKPPPAPQGQPPNQPPPIGFGIFFIVCGFLIPLLAYGFYKLTMASPGFAMLSGAGTVVNVAESL
jgi:hypothetical protein